MARRHQLPKMLSGSKEISEWNKFTGFSSSPTFDSPFGASLQPNLTKFPLSLSNVAPKLPSPESKAGERWGRDPRTEESKTNIKFMKQPWVQCHPENMRTIASPRGRRSLSINKYFTESMNDLLASVVLAFNNQEIWVALCIWLSINSHLLI